jgi:hypothetical protein
MLKSSFKYIIGIFLLNNILFADIYLRTSTKEVNLSNDLKSFYTEEYSEEYQKELYELENLYATSDLYKILKLDSKEYKKKLSILKNILKREAILKYIKDNHTIANSRYLEYYDNHNLYLPKRYDIEILKYKDKKLAKRVFNLLNTGKTYKEIKIVISKISKIEEFNRNYILLKEIEDNKINNKLKKILLNKNNPMLVNRLIEIDKIYYIILINKVIKEFNKKEYLNKLNTDTEYKKFINTSIINKIYINKLKEIKNLFDYKIIIN